MQKCQYGYLPHPYYCINKYAECPFKECQWMKQPKWLERAKETYRFHRSKLLANDKWTLTQTAKSLRRGIGPICEDLLIARWCKTHESQLERFSYAYEAMDFIRKKQKELELSDID